MIRHRAIWGPTSSEAAFSATQGLESRAGAAAKKTKRVSANLEVQSVVENGPEDYCPSAQNKKFTYVAEKF